jgi:2-polyprenyl-6-methoxyphenol hydroxylase-like FAD-dependent oxidoreductase
MVDMDPLKTWVGGRKILTGDAAHLVSLYFQLLCLDNDQTSVLPYHAPGALSSIEDAEALHVTLHNGTRENVHECLQRAFRIRYRRASECQLASHQEIILVALNLKNIPELWNYPRAERG